MRWAEKQRLGFIGERIRAGMTVRRSDLIEKFQISTPQASMDIQKFLAAHPGAMQYDRSKKAYVPHNVQHQNGGRDTTEAAKSLMYADDNDLMTIVAHDPGMIRDVAAALIFERNN